MKAAARPPAPGPLSFLAFDFGTRRIGVATGNTVLGRGEPRGTIAVQGAARWDAIAWLIAEWQPDALVLGIPTHPDGAEHENTRRARAFGRQLRGRFRLPVHEVDERYSTTEALAAGARDADAAAAVIIVEQFLRALCSQSPGPAQSAHLEPGPEPMSNARAHSDADAAT